MKAEELRIGNYVLYEQNSIEFIIKTISDDGFDVYNMTESTWIEYDQFAGIPVTEEWLLKLGWVWNEDTETFEKYPNGDVRMHLQYEPVSRSYTMFNYVLNAKIADRIWHVHQLQNLYFALTGSELTIKEDETIQSKKAIN